MFIISKVISSLFYIGFITKFPGTIASIVVTILAFLIYDYLEINGFLIIIILSFFIGIFAINKIETQTKKHDQSWIVIDELVGQLITLLFVKYSFIGFVIALIMFRIFDITKPFIIGYIDKKVQGGLGVMLDDVVAGIFAGICSYLIMFGLDKII